MYMAVKHTHLLLVVLSILFFWFRVILKLKNNPLLQSKFIKIAPHVVDTLLLIAGISLAVILSSAPWDYPWLIAKIIALIIYIDLGFLTLKRMKSVGAILASAFAATAVFAYMLAVAVTKTPWLGLF